MKRVTSFQVIKESWWITAAIVFLAAGLVTFSLIVLDSLKNEARNDYQEKNIRLLEKELDRLVFNRIPAQAANLARNDEIVNLALGNTPPDNTQALTILETARQVSEASIVYVMNPNGLVVGCSPMVSGETLTGDEYAFRPYFKAAIGGENLIYPALGLSTAERGIYFSVPIKAFPGNQPIGVLIYKASLAPIDALLRQFEDPVALLSPDGVVFASNQPGWLYHAAFPIEKTRLTELIASRQFADQPLPSLPFNLAGGLVFIDQDLFAVSRRPLPVADWLICTIVSMSVSYPVPAHRMQIFLAGLFIYLILSGIILVLLFNIHKRKRVERELRVSEKKYRSLFEDSPVSLWEEDFSAVRNFFDELKSAGCEDVPRFIETDADEAMKCAGKIQVVDVNRATLRLFKARTKEDLYGGLDKILPSSSKDAFKEELLALARGDQYFETELVNRTLDGEVREVQVRLSVAPGFEKSLKKVLVSMLDVTSRNQAVRALRASDVRHKKILKTFPHPVAIFEPGGRVSQINPAFTQVFGWTYDELPGRLADYFPAEDFPAFLELFKCMLSGESRAGSETRCYNKKGAILNVSISFASWRDLAGTPAGHVVIIQDITDRKKLEAQLRQAQKMEAIGTLAGGLAHDFNNMLQGISGYISLMLLSRKSEDKEREYLRTVDHIIRRSTGMIRQLLTISRNEERDLRPLDFNKEIQDTCSLLERAIPRTIRIETRLDDKPLFVNADPTQLEQVILNLGTNARDAMPDGGELVFESRRVEIGGESSQPHLDLNPGRYVLLKVSDTGSGMSPEIVERIFEPFFTTKDSSHGTGLGLAMVYNIIKNHNGRITCYSETGQGTTFSLYLPLLDRQDAYRETTPEKETEITGGQERILLVDDDVNILDTSQAILEQFGYTVLRAESGEEAVEIYLDKGSEIDMVVLDLNMPGMGGTKCMHQLLEINAKSKVLVTSGLLTEQRTGETLFPGAAGILGKPYRLTDLLGNIRLILDSS